MTLDVQLHSIISMVISGIYLGIARETFQRFSPIWQKNIFIIYLLEILFWFLQTIIIFFVLYKVNYGELRIYTFLSVLLGYSIYVVMFRAIYKRLLTLLIKFTRYVIRIIHRMITIFIVRPIKFIVHIVIMLLMGILTILLKLINILFYPVKRLFKKINIPLPKRKFNLSNKLSDIYSTIKDKLKKR